MAVTHRACDSLTRRLSPTAVGDISFGDPRQYVGVNYIAFLVVMKKRRTADRRQKSKDPLPFSDDHRMLTLTMLTNSCLVHITVVDIVRMKHEMIACPNHL